MDTTRNLARARNSIVSRTSNNTTTEPHNIMHLRNQSLFAVSILSLTLLTSCDRLDLPEISESEGPSVPKKAKAAAAEVFAGRFAKVGDSYYTVRVTCLPDLAQDFGKYMGAAMRGEVDFDALEGNDAPPLLFGMELIELKGLRTEVVGDELSQADKLNGITWKGQFKVRAQSERRRQLDLMVGLKAFAGGASEVLPGWTDRPLRWSPSPAAIKNLRSQIAAANGEEELSDEERMARNFMNLFSGQFLSAAIESHTAGGWRDWWTPENSSYQTSDVVVRDGDVTVETNEDVDSVLPDGETIGMFMPAAGSGGLFDGMITAAAAEDEQVFLLSPNVKALKDQGLLD